MEQFLHPMFLFDAILPFGAGFLFCCWMLWDLRKENRAAAARHATQPPAVSPMANDATTVRKLVWDDMPVEELTPLIGRRLIYTNQQMLAHVYLKQGAIVPAHDHVNEQITYVLSGALRFWIGAHADQPGDTFIDIRGGEVLVIPSHVRHRAEALEDTLDVDIFNPPRQDWIDKSDDYLRTGVPMGNVPQADGQSADGQSADGQSVDVNTGTNTGNG